MFSKRHGKQAVVEYNPTEDKETRRDGGVLNFSLFRQVWTSLRLDNKKNLSLKPKMVEKAKPLSHNLCTCMHPLEGTRVFGVFIGLNNIYTK